MVASHDTCSNSIAFASKHNAEPFKSPIDLVAYAQQAHEFNFIKVTRFNDRSLMAQVSFNGKVIFFFSSLSDCLTGVSTLKNMQK
jgi:hypothetical protein